MSFILTQYVSWMLHSLILSILVLSGYNYLKRLNVSSQNRYKYLKISFLGLPFLFLFSFIDLISIFEPLTNFRDVSVGHLMSLSNVEAIARRGLPTKVEGIGFHAWATLFVAATAIGISLIKLFSLGNSWMRLLGLKKSSQVMYVESNLKVYIHNLDLSPCAFGFLKPSILVSESTLRGLNEKEWETILLHEKLHIRRFDPLLNVMRLFVEAILSINPFIRKLSKLFETEMEFSLDEILVSDKKVEKKFYGELLFKMQLDVLQPSTAMGSLEKSGILKQRLQNLARKGEEMNFSKSSHYKVLAVIIAFSIIVPALGLSSFLGLEIPSINIFSSNDELENSCSEKSCPRKIVTLFQKAATDSAEAQILLAEAFLKGGGLEKDREKALFWYRRSYENGNGEAANELARLYADNYEEGLEEEELCQWFKRAADLGSSNGANNLANCYYYGFGSFPKDIRRAKKLKEEVSSNLNANKIFKTSQEIQLSGASKFWVYLFRDGFQLSKYP